jgi:hypothetical protein
LNFSFPIIMSNSFMFILLEMLNEQSLFKYLVDP